MGGHNKRMGRKNFQNLINGGGWGGVGQGGQNKWGVSEIEKMA